MKFLEVRLGASIERWPIKGESVRVGRGRENDLIVDHESISRSHLEIVVDVDGVRIKDLNSTNGLHVKGMRVPDAELGYDDWFVAGGVLMTVRKAIALTSLDRTPSHLPRGAFDDISGERKTEEWAAPGDEIPEGEAVEGTAQGVMELAALLGRVEGVEPTLQVLLDHLVNCCKASGAVLLGRIGNGWSVRCLSGDPMPPELEDAVLLSHRPGPERELVAGEGGALSLRVPGSDGLWLLVYPWSEGVAVAPEAHLVASICARLLEASRTDSSLMGSSQAESGSRPAGSGSGDRGDISAGAFEEGGFLAASDRSRALLEEVDLLAASQLPVLVCGESGTGKELLVRRLHALSRRAGSSGRTGSSGCIGGRFVALNCAALPSELLEAELFGIERGVATGVDARVGRFRAASGGTLFLDEVGDLPLGLQPKLLRVLETGLVRPVGAPAPIPVDVRVVSATHQDLLEMVAKGTFRRDLYHRLAGAVVQVAPLRERREEILPLAQHLLKQAARVQSKSCLGFDLEVARLLIGYSWPGNVRELQHVLARAVALSRNSILQADLLPAELRENADTVAAEMVLGLSDDFRAARVAFEKLYFSQLMQQHGSNLSEAARRAGLTRSHLYSKLDEHGLR